MSRHETLRGPTKVRRSRRKALALLLIALFAIPAALPFTAFAHDGDDTDDGNPSPGVALVDSDPATWPEGYNQTVTHTAFFGCAAGAAGTVVRDACGSDPRSHRFNLTLAEGATAVWFDFAQASGFRIMSDLCVRFLAPAGLRTGCAGPWEDPQAVFQAPDNTTAAWDANDTLEMQVHVGPDLNLVLMGHYEVHVTVSYWGGGPAVDDSEPEPPRPAEWPDGYIATSAHQGHYACGTHLIGRYADLCGDIDARSGNVFDIPVEDGLTAVNVTLRTWQEGGFRVNDGTLCVAGRFGQERTDPGCGGGAHGTEHILYEAPPATTHPHANETGLRLYVGASERGLATYQVSFEVTVRLEYWGGPADDSDDTTNTTDASGPTPTTANGTSDEGEEEDARLAWPEPVTARFSFAGDLGCGVAFWEVMTIDHCDDGKDTYEVPLQEGLTRVTITVYTEDADFARADVCAIATMPWFDRACGGGAEGTTTVVYTAEDGTTGPWTTNDTLPIRMKIDNDELVTFGQEYRIEVKMDYWHPIV